jgi:hypothetical protein
VNLEISWRDGTFNLISLREPDEALWRLVRDILRIGSRKRGGLNGLILKPSYIATGGIWRTTHKGKELTIPFGIGDLGRKETS